jgi:hypothetical protein
MMKKILLITFFCWISVIESIQAQIVTTFAGSVNGGSTDGIGTAASFSSPAGIGFDDLGNFMLQRLIVSARLHPLT